MILPPNATKFERDMVEAITPHLDVKIRDIWSPKGAPPHFLPYLADAYSVDRWDNTWSTSEKRAAIEAAFFVHQHKGTIAAIRRVIEPFGFGVDVKPWHEQTPEGAPYTMSIDVEVSGRGIGDAVYTQMTALIDDAKALRSRVTSLNVSAKTNMKMTLSSGCYTGETVSVYPYQSGLASTYLKQQYLIAEHTIDKASVYPL